MSKNPSETPTSLARAGSPVSTDALVEALTAACSGMPEAEGNELARGVFTQTALDGDTDAFDALLPFLPSWTDRAPLLQKMARLGCADALTWLFATKPPLLFESEYDAVLRTALHHGHAEAVAVLVNHVDLDFFLRKAVAHQWWSLLDGIIHHADPTQLAHAVEQAPLDQAVRARAWVTARRLDGELPHNGMRGRSAHRL